MSEDKDEKEESTSITHTPRKRNIIPGIDNEHLAIGTSVVALGAVLYVAAKPHIDNFIQNMAMARQQTPPPPPPAANQVVVQQQPQLPAQQQQQQPQPEPTNEYVDEPEQTIPVRQPNGSNEGAELGETDHKNYQTTRRKRGSSSSSPFGASIARG